jgi:hypothetical protein
MVHQVNPSFRGGGRGGGGGGYNEHVDMSVSITLALSTKREHPFHAEIMACTLHLSTGNQPIAHVIAASGVSP